jgi:hypothetical protein
MSANSPASAPGHAELEPLSAPASPRVLAPVLLTLVEPVALDEEVVEPLPVLAEAPAAEPLDARKLLDAAVEEEPETAPVVFTELALPVAGSPDDGSVPCPHAARANARTTNAAATLDKRIRALPSGPIETASAARSRLAS